MRFQARIIISIKILFSFREEQILLLSGQRQKEVTRHCFRLRMKSIKAKSCSTGGNLVQRRCLKVSPFAVTKNGQMPGLVYRSHVETRKSRGCLRLSSSDVNSDSRFMWNNLWKVFLNGRRNWKQEGWHIKQSWAERSHWLNSISKCWGHHRSNQDMFWSETREL